MTSTIFTKALLAFGFVIITSVKANAQGSTSITLDFNGAQALGCCDICGNDYWCVNNSGGCGTTAPSDQQSFFDPIPAGNVITQISVTYFGTSCNATVVTSYVNSINLGGSSTNSNCNCGGCDAYSSFVPFTPGSCGVSTADYNYGGWNTFKVEPNSDYCFDRVVISFNYGPAGNFNPPQPGAISGSLTVCSGSTPGYSIAAGTDTYTWTVPVGWTITGGQNTNAISTIAGSSGGNICVTASNSCGTSPATCLTVSTTSIPGAPNTPSGNVSVCGSVAEAYSTGPVPGASSYTWTVPAGWSITGGQGTTNVSVNTSPTSGNICVTADNSCGSSAPACLFVNTNAVPNSPAPITGIASSCSNVSTTYNATAQPGAISYTWSVPATWNITGGQGTQFVTVTTGTISGNICATANNACGSSTPACMAVTITTEPSTPGSITGNNIYCPGGVEPYSIVPVPGATSYNWTVPAGWTIAGQGSNSINATTTITPGQVCVTASNACGTSLPSCLNVNLGSAPATPGSITGPNPVCPNLPGNNYSIPPVAGATSYAWTVPAGWVITGGGNTTNATITSGSAGGNICVTASNACGTSSPSCLTATIDATPSSPGMITGPGELCINTTQTWSCSVVPGATTYTWSITGGVINSGQTTNTINATFTGSPGSLCVTADNACGSSAPTCQSITVSATSVGGNLTSSDDTVCTGSNSGTVTLTGYTGGVVKWQLSIDGGVSWSDITNTTNTQIFNNLLDTTLYRAIVVSGTCPADTSSTVTIYVEGAGSAGEVVSSAVVCAISNGDTLDLINYAGVIDHWEYSTDNGITWDTIWNTDDTLVYTNLQVTTLYRVIMTGGGGGGCPNNVSSIAAITVFQPSVGGTILSDTTVCSGSNIGTLFLTGQMGNINDWEASFDGGSIWFDLSNTADSIIFVNLTQTTMFRVEVQSGVCPVDYSTPVTVTVDPVSNGGYVASNASVCTGTNSGTLNINNYTGTILAWGYSTDGGVTWIPDFITTPSYSYLNLTTTTVYTAVVQSGVCSPDTATFATIYVDSATVGGTILSDDTVCSGNNSGILTLNGYIGLINGWQISTDGGSTWIPISNITATQGYNNLIMTSQYRVEVESGSCGAGYSSTATLTVDAPSNAGLITGGDIIVCADTNSGYLLLNGYTGNVLSWEESTDGGITWSTIINTSDTQAYVNLTASTLFRAVVANGVCSGDTSAPVYITVNPVSDGGAVFIDDTVCSGSNNGILALVGQTGIILNWETSVDGGNTWSVLANNTDTLNYNNVLTTTIYRVNVQNGVCPADYSLYAVISVDPPSVGGTVLSSDIVCSTINIDTLILNGYTGNVIGWEYSIDGGASWGPIPVTTGTLPYSGLTTSTLYRAIVQSGVCPADTSSTALITVDPLPAGGMIIPKYTVCLDDEKNDNHDTLALIAYSGTIQYWEYFDTQLNQWTPIANTNDTLIFDSLTVLSIFRVVVGSPGGACPTVISTVDTIFIDQPSVAGDLHLLEDTCCSVQGGVLVNLTGFFTKIVKWEFSLNNGATWNSLFDTVCGTGGCNWNDTLTYSTLPQSVSVRAIAKNGVCPMDTSNAVLINKIVAVHDYDTLNIDENLQIELTRNDTGVWSAIDFCTLPKFGTATITVIGTQGILSYTPVPESNGRDTLTYYICDDLNCTSCDTAYIYLTVLKSEFFIPTGFSPDDDGINDKWVIQGLNEYPDNEVQIFNRWGDLVYRSKPYNNDFEGKPKNAPMVVAGDQLIDGTYFYIFKVFGNEEKTFNGFFELRRKE